MPEHSDQTGTIYISPESVKILNAHEIEVNAKGIAELIGRLESDDDEAASQAPSSDHDLEEIALRLAGVEDALDKLQETFANGMDLIARLVMAPLAVHRIAACDLRHTNTRQPCLPANLSLFVVRPKPLLLTLLARHRVPQDVH